MTWLKQHADTAIILSLALFVAGYYFGPQLLAQAQAAVAEARQREVERSESFSEPTSPAADRVPEVVPIPETYVRYYVVEQPALDYRSRCH